MLAETLPQRRHEEAKTRLIEQAYSAWLLGSDLHVLPLALAPLLGASISPEHVKKHLDAYPDFSTYLRRLGLLEEDDGR